MLAPSKDLTASFKSSFVSISKWFVGSSRRQRLMGVAIILKSASRALSPPERTLAFFWTSSPGKPKAPNQPRSCSAPTPIRASFQIVEETIV